MEKDTLLFSFTSLSLPPLENPIEPAWSCHQRTCRLQLISIILFSTAPADPHLPHVVFLSASLPAPALGVQCSSTPARAISCSPPCSVTTPLRLPAPFLLPAPTSMADVSLPRSNQLPFLLLLQRTWPPRRFCSSTPASLVPAPSPISLGSRRWALGSVPLLPGCRRHARAHRWLIFTARAQRRRFPPPVAIPSTSLFVMAVHRTTGVRQKV